MICRPLSLVSGLALGLVACAKPSLGVRTDVPPPPVSTPASVHETFEGIGGTQLFGRSWRPAGEVRGVLVIMHGLRDHGDRYAHVAERLVERGYAVYAFDLRGHGRSAGRRATIASFDDYLADFDRFMTRVVAREPGRPVFAFGHSMGGAIVTLWAEAHPAAIAGAILSAPALQIDVPPITAAVIRMSSVLTPNLGQLAPTNEGFSSDPRVEAGMANDPLIYQPGGPVHTAAGLVGAIERIWAGVDRLSAPLLCLHGTADPLTAPAGCRDLVRRAVSTDKALRLYDDQKHDLVHEPKRDEVIADMIAWLDAHTGGPATTFPRASLDQRVRGDGRKPSLSVGFAGGYRRDTGDGGEGVGGGAVRARVLLGGRLAWPVGLDAEIFGGDHLAYRAALSPIGVAMVHPDGHVASISAGAGISDIGGAAAFELALALDLEAQLGPVRMLAWGRFAWLPGADVRADGTSLGAAIDELSLGAAIRLGRNHRYWSTANAGLGPFLGITLDQAVDRTAIGLLLGVHLWGGS